tara:strand:- start:776 stop:901 length:126 start_codon:yes stop_codon:yes gene_type:complete
VQEDKVADVTKNSSSISNLDNNQKNEETNSSKKSEETNIGD